MTSTETVAAEVAGPAAAGPARRRREPRRLGPGVVLALLVLGLAVLAAFAPGLLTSHSPTSDDVLDKLRPPSAEHWFGTDQLGRDVFARVVHGAGLSLRAPLIAVAIAFGVGSTVGLVSGFVGGAVDAVLMRLVDILLAVPSLLLSLAIVAALGFGITNVAVAVGIASVASFARITRAEALRVRASPFVEAAVVLGVRRPVVLARHVLPHAIGPALVLSTLEFGTAILSVSALSFLGYGEPPPTPEWGKIVSEGRDYLATAWWVALLPSLVIAATVLATNRVSRWLDTQGAGR
ncbi:ABC transporter permease [Streptomyces radicis]|uniref:ABC transporter permease n=1 Tax=Streptomyces radicis TaxID=1750517 RepID=A0A3A9W5Q1_9ACTN|nr:ABC transporter permease [Streptomyces radicis]RKN04594.1 ABC transporter permease [Streptomyces radicis]RKN15551.1 ABC transporter permease [Streptomyces radicis]